MPSESEYAAILQAVGFAEFETSLENADRNFKDKETMIKWIDQPCIVPFLEYLEEPEKQGFRDMVVAKMLEKTAVSDGTYFVAFRRLHVSAEGLHLIYRQKNALMVKRSRVNYGDLGLLGRPQKYKRMDQNVANR